MNLIGKHTTKTIILWVGIITALLLIVGSFFQFNSLGIFIENSPDPLKLEQWYGIVSLVQDTMDWLKL